MVLTGRQCWQMYCYILWRWSREFFLFQRLFDVDSTLVRFCCLMNALGGEHYKVKAEMTEEELNWHCDYKTLTERQLACLGRRHKSALPAEKSSVDLCIWHGLNYGSRTVIKGGQVGAGEVTLPVGLPRRCKECRAYETSQILDAKSDLIFFSGNIIFCCIWIAPLPDRVSQLASHWGTLYLGAYAPSPSFTRLCIQCYTGCVMLLDSLMLCIS